MEAQNQQVDKVQMLKVFIGSKVEDDKVCSNVLALLEENGIETLEDYQVNISSEKDLIELIGVEENVAKLIFSYEELHINNDLYCFISSKVNNVQVATNLFDTLKQLGTIFQQCLGIESQQMFELEIQNWKQMVDYCHVSEETASLFFQNDQKTIPIEKVQETFPISYQFVHKILTTFNISSVEEVKYIKLESLKAAGLKEYQILRLLKHVPDIQQSQAVFDFINQIVKDKAQNQKVVQSLISEGATFFSFFEECTEQELKDFGLLLIQIKKIKSSSSQLKVLKSQQQQQFTELEQRQEQQSFSPVQEFRFDQKNSPFSLDSLTELCNEQQLREEDKNLDQDDLVPEEILNERLVEEIRYLISDYQTMPQCFVKQAIKMVEIITAKIDDRIGMQQIHYQNKEHEMEVLLNSFEELQNLKHEETEDCCDGLQNIYNQLQCQNWKKALVHLQNLLKKAMPLNLKYLFRLVNNVQHSAKLLSGQDVILFLGGTGVGKSTTIHFLAGSKFKIVSKKGLFHFEPIKIRNKSLEFVKCSPFAMSETRYITPVLVDLNNMGLDEDISIILCDSPGFDDSAGEEVDIANSIGIIQAVQNCKSVRPVILLSFLGIGDRGQGIKAIAKTIAGMIPSVQEHIKAFTYFFSKFPEDKKNNIHSILSDILDKLNTEDKMDVSFTKLLKDMIKQTRKEPKIIDPMSENAKQCLEDLMETYPIKHPNEAFVFFISEKSQSALNDETNLIQLRIRKFLEGHKFEQINYYLNLLKTLQQHLKMDQITYAYEDLVNHIKNTISKRYDEVVTQFNKCFREGNSLSQEDLKSYQEQILIFSTLNNLRTGHLGQDCIQTNTLEDNLGKQLQQQIKQIKVVENITDSIITFNLKKIEQTALYFQEFETLYADTKLYILEQFHHKIRELETFIDALNVDLFIQNCNILKKFIQNISSYFPKENLEENYQKILKCFILKLQKECSVVESFSNSPELNQENLKDLKYSFDQLLTVKENLEIYQFFSQQDITNIYEEAVQKILGICEKITREVLLDCQKDEKFDKTQEKMELFNKLRQISSIEQRSSQLFYQALEQICTFITKTKIQLDVYLQQFQKDELNDTLRLKKCLLILNKAVWIKNFKEDIYTDTIDHVKSLLSTTFYECKEILDQMKIDLDNPQNILPYEKYAKKIKLIQSLIKQFPDSQLEETQENEDYEVQLFEQVTSVLGYIYEEFSEEKKHGANSFKNMDFVKLEKSLIFHKESMSMSTKKKFEIKYVELSNQLRIFITEFKDKTKISIKQTFKTLSEYIETFEDEKLIIDIQKNGLGLINQRIHDIMNLNKYNQIVETFTDDEQTSIIKDFKTYLNQTLNNLEEKMNEFTKTQNYHKINQTFFVARIMISMDEFMNEGRTFQSIHSDQQKIFYNDAPNLYKDIIHNLEKKNYLEVSNQLMNLESAKKNAISEQYLKKAKTFMYNSLDSLLEQTLNKVKQKSNIQEEKLEQFVTNLKDVEKALTHLDWMIEENLKLSLKLKQKQIQGVIEKALKDQLEQISQLIIIRKFAQVNTQLEKIDNINNILDNYCSKSISELRNTLVTDLEKEIDSVRESYEKVQKDQNVAYREHNYGNILELNGTVKERSIYEDQIDDEFKQKEEILDDLVLSQQYEKLLVHLKENTACDYKLLQKIKDFVRKSMADFHENIKSQIMANNTKDALYSVRAVYDFKQKFMFKFQAEIQIEYSQIQATFASLMEKVQGILIKIFVNTDVQNLSEMVEDSLNDSSGSIKSQTSILQFSSKKNDSSKDLTNKKQLDYYEACQIIVFYLKMKNEQKNAIQEIFQQTDKNVVKVIQKITEVVNQEQQLFVKSLACFHIPSLRNILQSMKKWYTLFNILNDETDKTFFKETTELNTLYATINKLSYKQMLIDISNKVVDFKTNFIKELSEKRHKLKKEMDEFYSKINQNLNKMKNVDKLKEYQFEANFSQIMKECLEAVQSRINNTITQYEEILNKEKLTKEDCLNIGNVLNNLTSMAQNLNYEKGRLEHSKKQLEDKLKKKIDAIYEEAKLNPQPELLSNNLIELKLLCDNVIPFKEIINEKVEDILKYQTKNNKKNIVKLSILLDANPIGKILISEHKTFAGIQNSLFNSKIQRHPIETVLQQLKGDDLDLDILKSRYEEFDKQYKEIIKWYIQPKNFKMLSKLVQDTKIKAGGFSQQGKVNWGLQVLDTISITAAHIFALYTLQNSSSYFEQGGENQMDYLFTPHPAQVISIFRLLGLGYSKKPFIQKVKQLSFHDENQRMQNNLIQIGTGEGKSVTLAIASSLLALCGFDVYCACYSNYLSKRDFTMFSQLFTALNISQKIHYGSFNEICEKLLNTRFNIRLKVQEFISHGTLSSPNSSQTDLTLRILLIDEVDVFLNKEFYGNIYSPSLLLQDPTIKAFTDYLWEQKNNPKLELYQVQTSKEYKDLTSRYRGWDDLILELTKEMILCLQNFEGHTYVVNEKENKIGYQLLDSITYNAVQSYNTLFAYYLECTQKKTIAKCSLEENLFLSVRCGEFSYADIPQDFVHIMGVTGTLETLTPVETEIIEQYGLKKRTYIPSVFGKNNLRFNEHDIFVENQDDYFNVIRREIYNKLNPDSANSIQRAVLVFFESTIKLQEFFNSSAYDLQDTTNYLTEQADANEKDSLIKNATNVGQITFLTRAFGRGTDFVVRDEVILNNGGVHVIQTFLSEELSEEVQIKGRTARQGNVGSYSMILLDQSLEFFGISLKDIEDNKGRFIKLLGNKRNEHQLQQQLNNKDFIKQVQDQHIKSKKFLTDLGSGNVAQIKSYLKELNKGPQIQLSQTRTLCLIDATGSMGTLLSKVKNTVHTMFERANQTLKEGGFNPDSFLIKFAVFRNYGQNENEILVASGWESSPQNLREFIQNIKAFGGGSPGEAVEVGFQFAELDQQELKENNSHIDQILLIGDAPSNTPEETINHRKCKFGEKYWSTTKFQNPGNLQSLVQSLKAQQIVINTFYLTDYAKNCFIQIASLGGGVSQFLDINSNQGAETLTNLVTVEILRKVGNQGGSTENGEKLVQAYKTKYLSYY